MKPEVKEKWVAALRSGEYRQGMNALRRGEQFCCLGVLCDLAVRDGAEVKAKPGTSDADSTWVYDESVGILPESVVAWAGLDSLAPRVESPIGALSLPTLNDGGYTFEQIADFIEDMPEDWVGG